MYVRSLLKTLLGSQIHTMFLACIDFKDKGFLYLSADAPVGLSHALMDVKPH